MHVCGIWESDVPIQADLNAKNGQLPLVMFRTLIFKLLYAMAEAIDAPNILHGQATGTPNMLHGQESAAFMADKSQADLRSPGWGGGGGGAVRQASREATLPNERDHSSAAPMMRS